jgi:hypothetical protein
LEGRTSGNPVKTVHFDKGYVLESYAVLPIHGILGLDRLTERGRLSIEADRRSL